MMMTCLSQPSLPRTFRAVAGRLTGLLGILLVFSGSPAAAQNCTSPTNLVSNPTFNSSMTTGYSSVGSWLWNSSLPTDTYGTIYASRAAVQNPSAAPGGAEAAGYPAATTSFFVINENDAANDSLTIQNPGGSYVNYTTGAVRLWFDMGWRQAGGTTTQSAKLEVKMGGITYFTITTVVGNNAGSATGVVSNSATLISGTPTSYAVTASGGGQLSQWNTIGLSIPYSGTSMPTISFVMSGGVSGAGVSDDFAIDRIYVPVCTISPLTVTKSSSVVSDPMNGSTNPKMVPGATIRYCITAFNPNGDVSANATATDTIPSGQTYVPGSIRSGTSCLNPATVEDDDATGADESDPFGASYAGGTFTGLASALAGSSSFAFTYNVTIN